MSRILFDQNVPRALGSLLTGHEVRTAAELGWAELENGELLRAADEAGFVLMVTCNQNIRYQQNMNVRPIGLVVLSTNRWQNIRASAALIPDTVSHLEPRGYIYVECASLPGRQG